MKIVGSIARSDNFGSFLCENCPKHRTKRSFWKLFVWKFLEALHILLVVCYTSTTTQTPPQEHHHKNTTTRTPPHQHKKHHDTTTKRTTTPPQKHRHKNTTTQTRPHHHKNITTKTPQMHGAVVRRTCWFCWMNPVEGFGGSIARNCAFLLCFACQGCAYLRIRCAFCVFFCVVWLRVRHRHGQAQKPESIHTYKHTVRVYKIYCEIDLASSLAAQLALLWLRSCVFWKQWYWIVMDLTCLFLHLPWNSSGACALAVLPNILPRWLKPNWL